MMEMMYLARRSITIVDSFLSTFEIARINKKLISEKEDVCVRIVIPPEKASDTVKVFLSVKNHVRLFAPPFEGLSPPFHHLTTVWSPLLNLHGW